MDFHLPEIGEGVYEAEVVAWKVQPGDRVKPGQDLVEVLTDKATMTIPAPFAGTIRSLLVEPGQTVRVGQVLLTYEPAGAAGSPASASRAAAPSAPATAPSAAPAPSAAGAVPAPPGMPPPAAPAPGSLSVPGVAATPPAGNGPLAAPLPVQAAPSVRYLARQLGIDLSQVRGTGPGGRILLEDLSALLRQRLAAPPPRTERRLDLDLGKPGTRLKLQGLRRRIAEHLVQAKRSIPHYSYVEECEVSDLVRLRQGLQAAVGSEQKITYLAFFVKAVVAALQEVPLVNATFDEAAGEIVLHDHYHIGIAVATSQGLLVPVLRDADKKDLFEIAQEIVRLSQAARAGQARREELQGSTFTITSIGNIGGLFATPVINYPEVGILGIGRIVKRPVFDAAGNLRAADLVYLSFSFDHRVVDGAVGATFGNAVVRQLQNPVGLLLPPRRTPLSPS